MTQIGPPIMLDEAFTYLYVTKLIDRYNG